MQADQKVVYLTFDDGPVPGPTEFALDQLARFSIRATFFCIGDNVRKHPDIFRRLIADGHSVGNHTVNHLNGWKMRAEQYVKNVKAFDAIALEAGLARTSTLFRPPYGCITRKQVSMLADYRITMWDVLTRDYNQSLSREACLRGTLKSCRPGSIVVFHDSHKAKKNMEYALPRMIDALASKGYAFEAL